MPEADFTKTTKKVEPYRLVPATFNATFSAQDIFLFTLLYPQRIQFVYKLKKKKIPSCNNEANYMSFKKIILSKSTFLGNKETMQGKLNVCSMQIK